MATFEEFLGAVNSGDLVRARELLNEGGFNPAAERGRVLVEIAKSGRLSIMNWLLEEIPMLSNDVLALEQALIYATRNAHFPVVDRLLQIPALNNNLKALFDMLNFSAARGHLVIVDRLLQIPAVAAKFEDFSLPEIGKDRPMPLASAASGGHLPVLKRLLEIDALRNNSRECFSALASALQKPIGRMNWNEETAKQCEEIAVYLLENSTASSSPDFNGLLETNDFIKEKWLSNPDDEGTSNGSHKRRRSFS
jgi:ankyrin repeat protein